MNPIRKAAENLPGHWFKGDYGDGQGNYCAVGHLLVAAGQDPERVVEGMSDEDSLIHEIRLLNKSAEELFPKRVDFTFERIADFNDHDDTTEEEVLLVMNRAADLLDEGQ
jgi:hypothetical protein